ncbi:50S ribosomal protein L44e [Candidatus Woesearchaeota archaeon]|nr:50S ribosomal protein L44e [Candidatus Woesearchaeota archaeon]
MKMPKSVSRYCPKCRKHTQHKILQSKKRAPSSLSQGSKIRARKRGKARGFGNLGRYSKPAITKWKMTGKKSTKKTDLRYECSVCKKMHSQRKGFRAKKLEFAQ